MQDIKRHPEKEKFGSSRRNTLLESIPLTVSEAGRRGGKKTASTHGYEFYRNIGQKGGEIGGRRVRELIEEGKKAGNSK